MTKILVIDDDELQQEILQAILQSRAYYVSRAGDGEQGVALAQETKPDLIIVDLSMPKMTGLEVISQLRGHPDTKATPIVMVTGHLGSDSRDDAHMAGCDRYVTKPVDRELLLQAVEELLG